MATCEHKTTAVLADEGNVTIESCTWGCGAILVSVTDDNGIRHEFTADELLALRQWCEKIDSEAGAIIDNEQSHIAMYYDAMRENAALRERVAALETLVDSVGILCEEMYGAEHLQPFPVDMIPEAAKQKMDAVLDAWGKTNELGALLYEQPRAFNALATAEGGEFAETANRLLETRADLWQKMADEGGE